MAAESESSVSAGLLMFRARNGALEVFLVHPGGPFFAHKDDGAWSIPKGLPEPGEDLLQTAMREFTEETGVRPAGDMLPLGSVRLKSGKTVHAWAFEGSWEPAQGIRSNEFEMEWPPHSGRRARFPEIDRAEFFPLPAARGKINAAQRPFIERLETRVPIPAAGGEDSCRVWPDWLCPLDHTADVGFFLQANSVEELYARAAWALFATITDIARVRPSHREEVCVEAADRAALMVSWLSELNFRHATEKKLFSRFEIRSLSGCALKAAVYGEAIDPARHALHTEVKAVTFHDLRIEKGNDAWTAQIIFDV
jgi:predicted NUDIX family NTP pyrophosphohydrolase/SHS2 domain-containing protein